jgi:hypothetical protein
MRYKNNVDPARPVAALRSRLVAAACCDEITNRGFRYKPNRRFEDQARFSCVDDKTLVYLAEALEAQVQELFSTRLPGNRIYDLIENLETMLFRYARLRTATHAPLYYSLPIFQKC